MKHQATFLVLLGFISVVMKYSAPAPRPPERPQSVPVKRERDGKLNENLGYVLEANSARPSVRSAGKIICDLPHLPDGTQYRNAECYRTSKQLREDLEHTERWISWILVAPVKRKGQPLGLRITYKAPNPFARLGIQSGDILLSLNHVSANQILNCRPLLKELRTGTSLHFLLERKGVLLPLDVELP